MLTPYGFIHIFLYLQGKEVIEYYINELITQGITEIPRWTSPVKAVKPPDDVPSQDSGVRSRSNSVSSQHSHSSQSSLVLGATAASIHTEGRTPLFFTRRVNSFFANCDFCCLLIRERSGSVVECLTRDRRVVGSSLTGVTGLWSFSKTHLS